MICKLCKKNVDTLERHHIIPRSQGGLNTKENIIKICSDCHYKIHHPDYEKGDINQFNEVCNNAISNDIFSDGWGIIPNKIARDDNLAPGAKILYAEISSLCASRGYCWANNLYFSKVFKVSIATVSSWMTQLEKYLCFENRNSNKRKIRVHTLSKDINIKQPLEKNEDDLQENFKEPSKKLYGNLQENFKHNNIKISNNIIINIYIAVFEYWNAKKIVIHKKESFLNNILTSKKNLKSSYKQLSDIYNLDDIKKAIDNYDFVLKSKSHYWSHKWTLWDFLTRGLEKFLDAADPRNNYKTGKDCNENEPYEEEYLKKHGEELNNLG